MFHVALAWCAAASIRLVEWDLGFQRNVLPVITQGMASPLSDLLYGLSVLSLSTLSTSSGHSQ